MAFTVDLNNAIDSYLDHCKSRWATANPQRIINGPIDSQDWPPKNFNFEQMYLVEVNNTPLGKQGASASMPFITTLLQWTWGIMGTDLTSGIRGRVRGDRGRKNRQIQAEILNVCFPYFCEKKMFDLDQNTGLLISQSLDPKESIRWTIPQFPNRQDINSGIIYGTATVYLSDSPVSINV